MGQRAAELNLENKSTCTRHGTGALESNLENGTGCRRTESGKQK